ncbi:hypothetical protein Tco_0576869 [Tanacetum coccineum]
MYDISYIQRKEAEGSVVKKFFGQGEQVQETPDANEGETSKLSKKLQEKLTPTPRAWRLYYGQGSNRRRFGCRENPIRSHNEKMHSKGMKYFHVFIDSLTLVAQIQGNHMAEMETERITRKKYKCKQPHPQIEGNHAQSTKHERKYKEEIMDATILFHRIPQPRSFSGNQDKTIDQSGKSSTQGASEKA